MLRHRSASPNDLESVPVFFEPFGTLHFRSASRPVLFCDRIPCPILPGIGCEQSSDPVMWFDSVPPTIRPNLSLMVPPRNSASLIPGSVSAAEQFMLACYALIQGDIASAERSIQKALTIQARQPGRSADSTPASSWLILASISLLKRDFDSCEIWLRAAERSLHAKGVKVESAEFRHAAADLLVIQACLMAQTSHQTKAAKFFIEAFRCHIDAGAFSSAAMDLILRGRLLMTERRWSEAFEILDQASATLSPSRTPQSIVGERLKKAIIYDRTVVEKNLIANSIAVTN